MEERRQARGLLSSQFETRHRVLDYRTGGSYGNWVLQRKLCNSTSPYHTSRATACVAPISSSGNRPLSVMAEGYSARGRNTGSNDPQSSFEMFQLSEKCDEQRPARRLEMYVEYGGRFESTASTAIALDDQQALCSLLCPQKYRLFTATELALGTTENSLSSSDCLHAVEPCLELEPHLFCSSTTGSSSGSMRGAGKPFSHVKHMPRDGTRVFFGMAAARRVDLVDLEVIDEESVLPDHSFTLPEDLGHISCLNTIDVCGNAFLCVGTVKGYTAVFDHRSRTAQPVLTRLCGTTHGALPSLGVAQQHSHRIGYPTALASTRMGFSMASQPPPAVGTTGTSTDGSPSNEGLVGSGAAVESLLVGTSNGQLRVFDLRMTTSSGGSGTRAPSKVGTGRRSSAMAVAELVLSDQWDLNGRVRAPSTGSGSGGMGSSTIGSIVDLHPSAAHMGCLWLYTSKGLTVEVDIARRLEEPDDNEIEGELHGGIATSAGNLSLAYLQQQQQHLAETESPPSDSVRHWSSKVTQAVGAPPCQFGSVDPLAGAARTAFWSRERGLIVPRPSCGSVSIINNQRQGSPPQPRIGSAPVSCSGVLGVRELNSQAMRKRGRHDEEEEKDDGAEALRNRAPTNSLLHTTLVLPPSATRAPLCAGYLEETGLVLVGDSDGALWVYPQLS